MNAVERKILAAAFPTLDGGSRGAGAVAGAFPEKIGNAAVLHVSADGKVKFVESKDWGAGRGALVGAVIGIIGGPIGILAGGGIGALAAKLRDSGFNNQQLEHLGGTLTESSSAVVIEIAADVVPTAQELLKVLGAPVIVVESIDTSVADIFDSERPPVPEPQPDAAPVADTPPPAA